MHDGAPRVESRHRTSRGTWVQLWILGVVMVGLAVGDLVALRHPHLPAVVAAVGIFAVAGTLWRDVLEIAYAVETTATEVVFHSPRRTFSVPWTAIEAITGTGGGLWGLGRLRWRWPGGSCETWFDLEHRRELLVQASRRSPRLRALPG
jgi:hypothetical protein